jgi:hypothetical protein
VRAGGVRRLPSGDEWHRMDTEGARLLAARIGAGVRIGATIELDHDAPHLDLRAGDTGVVRDIERDGSVVVAWDRGFMLSIDPRTTRYHRAVA